MRYPLNNIEKLKQLTAEISVEKLQDSEEKREIVETAKRIYSMLDRPKLNKQAIREEFEAFMMKLVSII